MTHQNLARRMRPRNIDEIIGQSHLVGPKNHSPDGRNKTFDFHDSLRSSGNW